MKIIVAAIVLMLAGCCTPGGWMGLEKELAYDRQLEKQRYTAGPNNDEYFEYHLRGRIYVLSDDADARAVLAGGEPALAITRIAAGPKGETIVFGIPHAERLKKDGFGAMEMYEGRRDGRSEGFYAERVRDGITQIFDHWIDLEIHRRRARSSSGEFEMADGTRVRYDNRTAYGTQRYVALRGPAEPAIPPGCQCLD